MNKRPFCFLSLAFVFVLVIVFIPGHLGAASSSVYATTATPTPTNSVVLTPPIPFATCNEKQVILMLDQSSSIRSRNDTRELRFYGTRNLINILGNNYLEARNTQVEHARPTKIELAVVQFATRAEISLDWTAINPVDKDTWTIQLDQIYTKIHDADLTALESGTNVIRALKKAEELIKPLDPQVDGCPNRTVLLLTDGAPDKNGTPYLGDELEQYMISGVEMDMETISVKQIVDRSFSGIGNVFYVVGIRPTDPQDTYWEDTKGYWKQITGDQKGYEPPRADVVDNQGALGARMASIIAKEVGIGQTLYTPGPLIIPPYLETLRLVFYKPVDTDFMELKDTQGNVVTGIVQGINEPIQTIELTRPQPGQYELTTSAKKDDLIITGQLIFAHAQFVNMPTHVQQFTNFSFQLQLVDAQGTPYPEYKNSLYELHPSGSVIGPQSTWPVSLVMQPNSIIAGSFTPIEAGTHGVIVQAAVLDDNRTSWDVLKGNEYIGDFIADPVSVQIGEAVGKSIEHPTQFMAFTIPLSITNNAKQLVALSVPVTWGVKATSGLEDVQSMIKEKRPSSLYTLEILSAYAGDATINLDTEAPDPVTGNLYAFSHKEIQVTVDPVTVLVGSTSNDGQAGCSPTQYSSSSIPLQIVNKNTQMPITIDVPVTWTVSATTASGKNVAVAVEEVFKGSKYLLNLNSDYAGGITIDVAASGDDPITKKTVEFYRATIPITFAVGKRADFSIIDLRRSADPLTTFLANQMGQLRGYPTTDVLLIGRSFLFMKNDVVIRSRLWDKDAKENIDNKSLMPVVTLKSVDGKHIFVSQGWQPVGGGEFETIISHPGMGRFTVSIEPGAVPCGIEVFVTTGETIRLVDDFWTLLIIAVITLLVCLMFYIIIMYLLCRYKNRLSGFLVLVDRNGLYRFYKDVGGCWKERFADLERTCLVKEIKVRSWSEPKGQIRVEVAYYTDLATRKVDKEFWRGDLVTMKISLGKGCEIVYRNSSDNLPQPYIGN